MSPRRGAWVGWNRTTEAVVPVVYPIAGPSPSPTMDPAQNHEPKKASASLMWCMDASLT